VKALIKLGGTLLDAPESRLRLAEEIARAVQDGLEAVIVHGGGKQMTRYLADRGVESRFLNGLRVTTPEVLDAVLKVLAGSVNRELVAAFIACGAPAVGLCGMDALLTAARPISDELGLVGKPVRSDPRLLHTLIEFKYLPVVACVAGDRQGNFFNVNADQMAASVAVALRVDKLLFLTDVDGVRDRENHVRSTLSLDECRLLIENGVATGGMRAKLESAAEALEAGITEVVIAPGAVPDIVAKLLASGLASDSAAIGTRLVTRIGASMALSSHDRQGVDHA
jgi:acetylglutamate kinase